MENRRDRKKSFCKCIAHPAAQFPATVPDLSVHSVEVRQVPLRLEPFLNIERGGGNVKKHLIYGLFLLESILTRSASRCRGRS